VIDRIVRAIRLDWTVFREIAEDQNAMKEAAIIVAIVTFFSAVGTGIASGSFVGFLVSWLIAVVIGWVGWAVITYFVGTALFKGQADIPEMMRVLGYATAPNLLGFFQFIPCIGWIFPIVGWILALIAGVLAIREAMEFDTGTAIVTVLIGWAIIFVIGLVPRLVFGM
jgi:hypothetical protein